MASGIPTEDGALVFEKAQSALINMINEHKYVPGDRIPSERDLAEQLGISRMTARKAVDRLVHSGILERRGTSGTFIPAPMVIRPISAHSATHSISDIVRESGGQPGNKLLSFEEGVANLQTADKLKVKVGEPVLIVKRLRLVNNLPFCIETIWLPENRVPGLVAGDLVGDDSLYDIMLSRYGIKTGQGTAFVRAVSISKKEADFLGLYGGNFALAIESVVYDSEHQPIEYLLSLNHPNRVTFTAG